MNKIQENLNDFMRNPYTNLVQSGTFRVIDFDNLNKVISNTDEDFIIFANGGGRKFDIMFDRTAPNENGEFELYEIKEFIEFLLSNHKDWIFCYQLNKEQVILKKF